MVHHLDILDNYYIDIQRGLKTFEIRRTNRNYKIGDTLILKNKTTQKTIKKTISYINDLSIYNIKHIVILGLI
jgi:ASC-1-like (ASCH) protein